jgi:hypothetical protein
MEGGEEIESPVEERKPGGGEKARWRRESPVVSDSVGIIIAHRE